MARQTCTLPNCDRPMNGWGFCLFHYRRAQRAIGPFPKRGPTQRDWMITCLADSTTEDCIDWPFPGRRNGYGIVKHAGRTCTASRLMCQMAHGPAPEGRNQAAHSCGRSICVNPRHLRWATPKENSADMIQHGTKLRGSSVPGAKLTPSEVRGIRAMVAEGRPQAEAVLRYGVSAIQVSRIVRRERWSWLADDDPVARSHRQPNNLAAGTRWTA